MRLISKNLIWPRFYGSSAINCTPLREKGALGEILEGIGTVNGLLGSWMSI